MSADTLRYAAIMLAAGIGIPVLAALNAGLGRAIASPAAAFAGLAFADFAKIDIPADLANLRAWRARVAERPSIAQAC